MRERYITKPDPDLTANQLAQFLRASPQRRESILRAAKYQSRDTSAARVRYREARVAIARCLASNRLDIGRLYKAKEDFQEILSGKKTKLTDFIVSDARLSIEAIDAFIGALNIFPFQGLTFRLGEHRPPRIQIEEVNISVRPDLIVTATRPNLTKGVGGILMYFGKDIDKIDKQIERKEFGLTAATLVHRYAEQHLSGRGEPERRLCMSLDVFGQQAHPAPTSYKRRVANIEAACREIARQWDAIEPPPDWPTQE